jgi:hypothetical protein
MKYIHYGYDRLDVSKIKPIKNRYMWHKPSGGLWASPVSAAMGWKEWCEQEEFMLDRLETFCTFSLREDANIYEINSTEDVEAMPRQDQAIQMKTIKAIDFEKMLADGVDAIQFNLSANPCLYWDLYGWDCDCILIMNPAVIINE